MLIRQFYFPGWRVDLDNRTLSRETLESALNPQGLMTVAVGSPGRHRLRAWYEGPPLSAARNAVVALLSLSLTIVLFRYPASRRNFRGEEVIGEGEPQARTKL